MVRRIAGRPLSFVLGAAALLAFVPLPAASAQQTYTDGLRFARRGYQFRVNQVDASHWSGGLLDASVAVKPDRSFAIAWTTRALALTEPECVTLPPLDCDGIETDPPAGHAFVLQPDTVVYAREFKSNGNPTSADIGLDPEVACRGARRFPSLAARKQDGIGDRVKAAWDFTWNELVQPCDQLCGDLCNDVRLATNETRWNLLTPLALSNGPVECEAYTPSTAFSDAHSFTSWIGAADLCTRVFGRFDDGATFLVRDHDPLHAVSAACAAAARNERFAVCWTERDAAGVQTVRVRRVEVTGVGAIVDVGLTDRPSAVSMFDDGSFAVFWFDLSIPGDPSGRVALYSAAEPPVLLGAPIDVTTFPPLEGPTLTDAKLTVTVRGASAQASGSRALIVWEQAATLPSPGTDVAYRLIDTPTRFVGRQLRVALDAGLPKQLGESWQHTAVFRPDGSAACVWTGHLEGAPLPDGNVYCTVGIPVF